MFLVVLLLDRPTPNGLAQGVLHRLGDLIGVENGLAARVTSRTSDGLNQRALRAKEPFLISVQDSHERNLWQVQPFSQKINADQNVVFTPSKVTKYLDSLQGDDVTVKIADLH